MQKPLIKEMGASKVLALLQISRTSRSYTSAQSIKGEQVYSSGLEGFGNTSEDYNIRIENTKTGAGVKITSDQPLEKLVYWACPTTACPQPYIRLNVEPGKEIKWTYNYEFFTTEPTTK